MLDFLVMFYTLKIFFIEQCWFILKGLFTLMLLHIHVLQWYWTHLEYTMDLSRISHVGGINFQRTFHQQVLNLVSILQS